VEELLKRGQAPLASERAVEAEIARLEADEKGQKVQLINAQIEATKADIKGSMAMIEQVKRDIEICDEVVCS
jgi:hypothetical protein